MIVPDEVRKCVVFIGYSMADGEKVFVGSGFFIGRKIVGEIANEIFLITAKHVIKKIKDFGLDQVFLRVNLKDGTSGWYPTKLSEWKTHPNDPTIDIAFLKCGIPHYFDHAAISHPLFANEKIFLAYEVGLGEEVFITGLFSHHIGEERNIPIVRIGNLATLIEKNIATQLGPMEAILIEARSIGGLSGSPVFLSLGIIRYVKGKFMQGNSGPIFFLLGSIHGHFKSSQDQMTSSDAQGNQSQASALNVGIAIVVPIQKILETINLFFPETP
jgi:hypothetical protein